MPKTAVFHTEGGIGKVIASTAVIDCYKNNNPDTDIITVSAWPEIYLNNPSVSRTYKIGNVPYFYRDFIYNKDVEIFAQEPYKQTAHITKKQHLIKTWCDMVGVEHTTENPKIFLNFREIETAMNMLPPSDKPILIFQPFGGPGKDHQDTNYSWMRDIHPSVAQELVNNLQSKYHVVHVCYEFHPILKNCTRIDKIMLKKVLFSLLHQSQARLLIDSSLQHAAGAMGLSSSVVWVATQPEIFGYSLHNNIKCNFNHPEGTTDSYFYDYNFTGAIYECPESDPFKLFDIPTILKTLQ